MPIQPNEPDRRRLLAAGFLSAVVPGAGQLLAGRKIKGVVFFLLFCILLLLYWPLRFPKELGGAIFLAVAMVILCIWAAVDAAYKRSQGLGRPSQCWLAAMLPLALLGASAYSNWAMRTAGFRVYGMPSGSMENTINLNDRFVADGRYYQHHMVLRSDLVIFTLASEPGVIFIKRAIGLPGETILGSGGRILVDGVELQEKYATRQGQPLPEMDDFGPITVPAGKLFVLGDNRNNSRDSRFRGFGFVDLAAVKGKALYTIPWLNHGDLKALR